MILWFVQNRPLKAQENLSRFLLLQIHAPGYLVSVSRETLGFLLAVTDSPGCVSNSGKPSRSQGWRVLTLHRSSQGVQDRAPSSLQAPAQGSQTVWAAWSCLGSPTIKWIHIHHWTVAQINNSFGMTSKFWYLWHDKGHAICLLGLS